ncbi:unnamed protein product, partial [Didymodactylos carnosus]
MTSEKSQVDDKESGLPDEAALATPSPIEERKKPDTLLDQTVITTTTDAEDEPKAAAELTTTAPTEESKKPQGMTAETSQVQDKQAGLPDEAA